MTADPMQRAREMLAEAMAQVREERRASGQPLHGWKHEAALRALAVGVTEADTWKQKADFWEASAFEGDKQATEAERQRDALHTREEDGWRPIESAPRDGTAVLLWLGSPWSKVEKARWYEPWGNWQLGIIPDDPAREDYHGIGAAVPTHWRPLPPAPEGRG